MYKIVLVCLMLVSLDFFVAAPESINNAAVCP
jgi:hypothetical protein